MAAFTFNTQHQKHLLSIALCKYPSTLNAFNFFCLSPSLILSPPKHTPFFVLRAHASNIHTKTHESSTKATNLGTKKGNGVGFSSIKSGGERSGRQSANNLVGLFVEEKTGKRLTKDRNTREDLGFRRNKDIGSENSFTRYKSRNKEIKSSNAMDIQVVNNKMEKKTKAAGANRVKEEKIPKGSKRIKVDSPAVQFRHGLDMCCKKGDVMGAIQLYDLARREGMKLGQYQYAVFLYLCSSAASGIVQPAKSGSGGRSLNSVEVSNEVSDASVMELNELRNKSSKNFSSTEAYTRFPNNGHQLIDAGSNPRSTDKIKFNSGTKFDNSDNTSNGGNVNSKANSQQLDQLSSPRNGNDSENHDDHEIQVSEDVKKYALERGFEIYEQMCMDEVPMNEPTLTAVARMAMSMNNGDMAFDMVRKMKPLGLNPKLRSYGPALSVFCNNGDVDKAFAVEEHMLEHGVNPEELELEALLRVSVEAGKGDKVYYLLHKLRTTVRRVSPSTAGIIIRWFKSKAASRVGKRKWDYRVIKEAIENGGGGWNGQGWLGNGKWSISCTSVGVDAICKSCGEKLATIDLDPKETENFAESVASIAIKRDKDSSFQKFQKWLKYYGPFEAVIDGANVGLISQNRFIPSKINAIANGIRQKLPSKKWPLIVLHNKRVTGPKMNEPVNKALIEKWKNADSLYATPTGSNDDWYWLYAAIKFKCLIVTNDEMRDHTFQLLGNDFFPKWKERHQVHFNFTDAGPVFYMPPCFSVVIQESEKGHWHIPIATDHDYELEREWLCISRAKSSVARKDSTGLEDSQSSDHSNVQARLITQTRVNEKQDTSKHGSHEILRNSPQEECKNLKNILLASGFTDPQSITSQIEAAEKLGDCVIDFQI